MNNSGSLLNKFQASPDSISDQDYRFYALLKVVCTIGLITHFSWIFLFYFLDVPLLSLVNIVSVVLFTIALMANQRGHFLLAITIGIIEVIGHQIIGSTIIGAEAGLQYYIIIASFLPFLLPARHLWFKLVLLSLSIGSFLYIHYAIPFNEPISVLEKDTVLFLGYSNIIFAFSFLGIWGTYFAIAILSTEKKLNQSIQKTEKLLVSVEEKSIELADKNKAIADSINYSEKIQRSILPNVEDIRDQLPNTFIYFEPKDVIGGDFYWYFKSEDYCYFAVVDCTGHGVPGALMSMTIYALLNEIIIKELVSDTGDILSSLHRKLTKTLHQNKGDQYSQNGCDISLCRINTANNELLFSGAQNDLFIYNGNELKILKADKQSIGGLSMLGEFESERTFKSEQVTLSNKDFVVLTTDGVLDQLNEKDEPFSISNFKSTMKEMYSESPLQMKSIMTENMRVWKSNAHQLDDQLIAGFRVA